MATSGAFTIGAGSQTMSDPGPLVRRGDVVVVTTNYRLGALGFLHLDELGGVGCLLRFSPWGQPADDRGGR